MDSDTNAKAATPPADEIQLPAIPTCDTEIAPSFPGESETGDDAEVDRYAKAVSQSVCCMDDIPWGPNHPRYFDTAEEFFGTDPAADFVRWSSVQHWTVEEGIALSYGYDPRVINADALWNYPEHPFAEEYDRRRDIADRAVTAGQLSTLSSPRRFIKWAEGVGIRFPDGLSQMVNSIAVANLAKRTTTSSSGLKTRINKLSRIALGMADYIYGFNPEQPSEQEYETMAAELQGVGISVPIESIRRCLKAPADLYENLPEVEETLSRVVLGIAICHFDHDPKAPRSSAPNQIAEAIKKFASVDVDTIRARLKEAAAEVGLACRT